MRSLVPFLSEFSGGTKSLALACAFVGSLYLAALYAPISLQPLYLSPSNDVVEVVKNRDLADEEKGFVADTKIDQMSARPLFVETRRPVVVESVAEAAPVEGIAKANKDTFISLELVGIIADGETYRILLFSDLEGKTSVLSPGDEVEFWTFERVEGSTAVFTADTENIRLVLKARDAEASNDALVRNGSGNKPQSGRRRGRH